MLLNRTMGIIALIGMIEKESFCDGSLVSGFTLFFGCRPSIICIRMSEWVSQPSGLRLRVTITVSTRLAVIHMLYMLCFLYVFAVTTLSSSLLLVTLHISVAPPDFGFPPRNTQGSG